MLRAGKRFALARVIPVDGTDDNNHRVRIAMTGLFATKLRLINVSWLGLCMKYFPQRPFSQYPRTNDHAGPSICPERTAQRAVQATAHRLRPKQDDLIVRKARTVHKHLYSYIPTPVTHAGSPLR